MTDERIEAALSHLRQRYIEELNRKMEGGFYDQRDLNALETAISALEAL